MTDLLLEGKRIFVVEDDVANMAVMVVALKQAGAVVIQDPWNAETISLMLRHLPLDVILLDLMLRWKINGYDIYDLIKTEPKLAFIPVVAVSASDPEIEIPKARKKGFAGFIAKPISLRELPAQAATAIRGEPVWVVGRSDVPLR